MAKTFAAVFRKKFAISRIRLKICVWAKPLRFSSIRNASLSGAKTIGSRTAATSFDKFTPRLVWVSIESAEMVKHGVNAFLATCVTFANELAIVCERVGADAAEVERALRLEPRIGPRAYIKPGAAFAGGTLARDIVFLNTVAEREGLRLPLLGSVMRSNEAHKHWPVRASSNAWRSLRSNRGGARPRL